MQIGSHVGRAARQSTDTATLGDLSLGDVRRDKFTASARDARAVKQSGSAHQQRHNRPYARRRGRAVDVRHATHR